MAFDPTTESFPGFFVYSDGIEVIAIYDRESSGFPYYPNQLSTLLLTVFNEYGVNPYPTKDGYVFDGWYGFGWDASLTFFDLQTTTLYDVFSTSTSSIRTKFSPILDEESSDLIDVSSYGGGNMLDSIVFRTSDVWWTSANLDMREGKAFGHRHSLEQGPCRFGFHVPTKEEWEEVVSIVDDLGLTESIHDVLLLPKAGKKIGLNTDVDVGNEGYYHTRIPNSNGTENVFHPTAQGGEIIQMAIKNAISVRGFKNSPMVPTKSWTRVGENNSVEMFYDFRNGSLEGFIAAGGTSIEDNPYGSHTFDANGIGETSSSNDRSFVVYMGLPNLAGAKSMEIEGTGYFINGSWSNGKGVGFCVSYSGTDRTTCLDVFNVFNSNPGYQGQTLHFNGGSYATTQQNLLTGDYTFNLKVDFEEGVVDYVLTGPSTMTKGVSLEDEQIDLVRTMKYGFITVGRGYAAYNGERVKTIKITVSYS